MSHLFKNKQIQILVLLVAIQIFILFNFILPGYENKPYFETQVQQLEEELETRLVQKTFLEEREKLADQNEETNKKNIRHLLEKYSEESLQKKIGQLLRANSVKVHTQQIINSGNRFDLERYTLSQTLEGKYEKIITYISALLNSGLPVVLSEVSFLNLEPQERSPLLRIKLTCFYFLPNSSTLSLN